MEILRVDRTCAERARGVTIVIDVVRAFSVACYACAGGARELWLVRTTNEARALRQHAPDALLGGEIGGRLIPGFDFNNSPSQMAARDVRGRLLIQRTGAGTQGAVAAAQVSTCLLLCALTNARATAKYAKMLATAQKTSITLFPTFFTEQMPAWNEDQICADYLEALLRERDDARDIITRGIAYLHETERFAPWKVAHEDFPEADIDAVLAVDRFDFAIVGIRRKIDDITYVEARRVDVVR